ncbi:hypothetical protein AGMMS49942_29790 [Spirochaetia bacterium]|nr:hypothetical protein AGMMS49942_29790 [Spirochaetia bacterium]
MKNSKIVLGMLVLVLAFGFVMMGCEGTASYNVAHVDSVDSDTIVPIEQWLTKYDSSYPASGGVAKSHTWSDLYVNFEAVEGATGYTVYLADPTTEAIVFTVNNSIHKNQVASAQPNAGAGTSGTDQNPATKIDYTKACVQIPTTTRLSENPTHPYVGSTASSGSVEYLIGIQAYDELNSSSISWKEDKITLKWGY